MHVAPRARPASNGMKWTPFQMVILGVFIVAIMGGVAVFALFGGLSGGKSVGQVTIWGTVDRSIMESVLSDLIQEDDAFQTVDYEEKDPKTYNAELIEALASNKAPELFMLAESDILSFQDKISVIPYSEISEREFRDTFVNESDLFLSPGGIVGMPYMIDPLVMYYNRDLFAGAGIATYPRTWADVQAVVPKMTTLDTKSDVRRSAVALGTFDNISHAKEILSALLMQVGDPISKVTEDGQLESTLGNTVQGAVENPAESALRFYTSFSNPTQSVYSWNRALPDSFNVFAAGDLGVYFGLASEYAQLVARNPNLAFDVSVLPQTESSRTSITYGRMVALAIPQNAKNYYGASLIAQKMTSNSGIASISSRTGLPPVRRDLLSALDAQDSIEQTVFAESALISRSWFDPNPQATRVLFKTMIDSVVSGRARLGEAVSEASAELSALFARFNQ